MILFKNIQTNFNFDRLKKKYVIKSKFTQFYDVREIQHNISLNHYKKNAILAEGRDVSEHSVLSLD